MLGWFSAEAARASFSKRFRRPASEASSAGSTLIATSRDSRVSRARYTPPTPPAPSGARISYGPSILAAASVIVLPHPLEEVKIRFDGAYVAVRVASAVPRDRDRRVVHMDDAGRVRRHQLLPELAPARFDLDSEDLPGQLLLTGSEEVASVSAPLIEAIFGLKAFERRPRSAVERQDEALSAAHVQCKLLPVARGGQPPDRLFAQDEARLAPFERENPEADRLAGLGSRDEKRVSVRQDLAGQDRLARERHVAAGDGQARELDRARGSGTRGEKNEPFWRAGHERQDPLPVGGQTLAVAVAEADRRRRAHLPEEDASPGSSSFTALGENERRPVGRGE